MTPRTKRALAIAGGLTALVITTALVLNAFNSNMVFFFSPSQVVGDEAPRERAFRIGGMVEEGSLQRDEKSLTVSFVVTDFAQKVPVTYTGLLPDLFREGKGVVAQGKLGEAELLYRQALNFRRGCPALGAGHGDTLAALLKLG